MTSPTKQSTQASALPNPGDKPTKKEAEIAQPGPGKSSSTNIETPPTRSSRKRRHSESRPSQPRSARIRLRTAPISAAQEGEVADSLKLGGAEDNDLSSEQSLLIDENTARLERFGDPHTPPNRLGFLTEDGLLTSLPRFSDSPPDQGLSLRFRDSSPGHRHQLISPSSLGPRHVDQGDSPSNRRIRRQPRRALGALEFGDWLPGRGPQNNDSSIPSLRHDDQRKAEEVLVLESGKLIEPSENRRGRPSKTQRSERVGDGGSGGRPTRPWEL